MSFKAIVRGFSVALLMVGALSANVASAKDGLTLRIGGVANVYFIDSTHAVASAEGTFAALSTVVTSFVPQPDGTILAGLTHNFITADNGFIITDDVMTLVPVPGSPNVFSFTVDYIVTKSGNGLEGFEGEHFNSRGFIDMNKGFAAVRYDGEISRKKK